MKCEKKTVMVDYSINAIPNIKTLKEFFNIIPSFGYTSLMLYTEDTYEIEGKNFAMILNVSICIF